MKYKLGLAALLGLALGLCGSVSIENDGDAGVVVSAGLALPQALAAPRHHGRRVARRTSRRTSRRVARRHSLPGGCAWRAPYHYCGGVYYQPIQEGGRTVYVVVNP